MGNLTRGAIYYSDNRANQFILDTCRKQIQKVCPYPIISVTLKPTELGANIVLENRQRSYPTMVEQIIIALEKLDTDIVFYLENDILYHPSHFEFAPKRDDIYYYNINNWRWDYPSDRAIHYDELTSLSMLCCNREFALEHYKRRLEMIEKLGWDKIRSREPRWARLIGYEPGTKPKRRGGFSDDRHETWKSEYPNIDIRHKHTFSSPKTHLEDFRHKPTNWQEVNVDDIEGWELHEMFKS